MWPWDELSWSEHGANGAKAGGLIPAWAIHWKVGLSDPCGSLLTQNILWSGNIYYAPLSSCPGLIYSHDAICCGVLLWSAVPDVFPPKPLCSFSLLAGGVGEKWKRSWPCVSTAQQWLQHLSVTTLLPSEIQTTAPYCCEENKLYPYPTQHMQGPMTKGYLLLCSRSPVEYKQVLDDVFLKGELPTKTRKVAVFFVGEKLSALQASTE